MNIHNLILPAVCAAGLAAPAENLIYAPSGTSKDAKFGNYVYSADNWKTEAGVNKRPDQGDVLVYDRSDQTTASPTDKGVRLGGIWYRKAMAAMNQGQIWIQSGGLGLTNSVTSGSVSWYCGIIIYGSEEFPVCLPGTSQINFQRYFDQNDGGAATMVKRGSGTLAFQDSSNWAHDKRATWKKSRLEAGTLRFNITGYGGKALDAQMFPAGHELTFADDGTSSGVTFSIGTHDLELLDVTLREAPATPAPNHAFTCDSGRTVTLRMNGTPGLNPMGFGGRLLGGCGMIWNPSSSDNVFVFSNGVSTTTGNLVVSNGTVRLEQGATFSQLAKLQLAAGTRFEVRRGAGGSFCAAALVREDATSRISVDGGAISFGSATCAGAVVPDGVYTSETCDWVEGDGYVLVNTGLPVQDAWWTNDDDHPKSLAAGVHTNWFGAHLTGAGFALEAGEGASVTLGAGGVDTPGAGATYVFGWPTLLAGSQVWRVRAGDTVTLPGDGVNFVGGATWYVNNADNGVLALDGGKSFTGNMVVSNGWLEATGDDALGGAGTTTFEMQNSSGNKGKLRLKPAAGRTEINVHRNLTFHYYKCGEWGNFMELPPDCTVNFHGRMETSSKGCVGNSWPCHWRYTCPQSTTVNWYGVMHAALNHHFPNGTHHVWQPLSGGDRFQLEQATSTVYLHAANNSVGAACGSVRGTIHTMVPYALDGRNANRLVQLESTGVIDLHGNDQALSILCCETTSRNGAKVTSDTPAFMRISGGNHVVDSNPGKTITNFVQWVGAAGVDMVRWAGTYPFVLRNTSSSTGTVQVTSGILKFAAPRKEDGLWGGKWPNASALVVKGGQMVFEHSEAVNPEAVARFVQTDGKFGKMVLNPGVKVKVAELWVDGVKQRSGIYGSSASGAQTVRDDLFAGAGVLRVGGSLATTLLVR